MHARLSAGARPSSLVVTLLTASFCVLAAGCLERELAPLNPCVVTGVVETVKANNIEEVDVLFMVDNSNSMRQEQIKLSNEFPTLIRVLATGDLDADGAQDFPPVKDLHVGVISSDMGSGNVDVGGVCFAGLGDDGILQTSGDPSLTGCAGSYPKFLSYQPEVTPDPTQFIDDFRCVAQLGTGGCGIEQQLEATLKALTPTNSSITFQGGTVGHGDDPGTNGGFLRPGSLLAVILVTDEDDCSVSDIRIFEDGEPFGSTNINLRCFAHPEAVHPVERYVNGFLALRDDPDLFVYAAITGVPADLVPDPLNVDFDAVLNDSRMVEEVDTGGTSLRTSCQFDDDGDGIADAKAFPPRRIVQVAQQLEAQQSNAVITSLCTDDFTPALQAITEKIASVLSGGCLPRQLNPDSSGYVTCSVVETLPHGGEFTSCLQLCQFGRRPFNCPDARAGGPADPCACTEAPLITTEPVGCEEGCEVCKVDQIPRTALTIDAATCSAPGTSHGWFYDNCSAEVAMDCTGDDQQRIAFTSGDEPKTGVTVRLECLQTVAGSEGGMSRGAACDSTVDRGCTQAGAQELCCEENRNFWQVRCETDADCLAQNLGGFVCDDRGPEGGSPFAAPVCVNPTCAE